MADWLGQLIASWPFWAVIVLVVFLFIGTYASEVLPWMPSKQEWWIDKQKRLEKENQKKNAKTKKG